MVKNGGGTPKDMMSAYEKNYGGANANRMQYRTHKEELRGPMCCCIPAKFILGASCVVTFILGLAVMSYTAFVYSSLDLGDHEGWEALLICIITCGVVVVGLSVVGVVAARTRGKCLLVTFFLSMAIIGGVVFGSIIYVGLESSRMDAYLQDNWEEVRGVFGTDVSRAEASEWLQQVAVGMGVTFGLLLLAIIISLGSSARLMGTGYTFVATNAAMVALAAVSVGIGVLSMGKFVPLVYILLFVSAALLFVAAVAGSCGAKNLNRECLHSSCVQW